MINQNPNSKTARRLVVLVGVGVGMTLAAGFGYGRLSQRWAPVPDLAAAGQELESFPKQIGDWQLLNDAPISQATLDMLSCSGYVNRKYVNRQSGETIAFSIVVGPPGPISVHTPEICYSSRAYDLSEPRRKITLSDRDGRTHSFWSLTFRSQNQPAEVLHVVYAWRADAAWSASERPRYEFAAQPMLYKLQMASFVPSQEGDVPDPCQEFLEELLRSGRTLRPANPDKDDPR